MYQLNPLLEMTQEELEKRMNDENITAAYTLGAAGSGAVGEELLRRNFDRLNGTVTRFHNTDKHNVADILQHGLKSKFAEDPKNITNYVLSDTDMADKKDLVYTSKDRGTAWGVGRQRKRYGLADNIGKTLKLKFNYDDISKLPRINNPEIGKLSKEDFFKKVHLDLRMQNPMAQEFELRDAAYKLYDDLLNGTHVFKGDISPEHIVGSSHYKSQIDKKRWLEYLKKHPKRFAKGVALSTAGLSGLGLAGYLGYKGKKKYDEMKNSEKKEG